MESIEAIEVQPLWHRFPAVFLYGLNLYPMVFAIGLSTISYFTDPGLLLTGVFTPFSSNTPWRYCAEVPKGI